MLRTSPPGRWNSATPLPFPPSFFSAAPLSASSSAAPGPFMAKNTPPTFTSGRQYSESMGRAATPRAVATSNCSRHTLRAASSARSLANSTPESPSCAHTYFKNSTRLPVGSIRVSCSSGLKILATTPGKPAPVPTSTSFPAVSGRLASKRLSAKCLSSIPSGSVMAVRFTFWLYSTKISAYWSSASSMGPVRAMPSAAHLASSRFLSIILILPLFYRICSTWNNQTVRVIRLPSKSSTTLSMRP